MIQIDIKRNHKGHIQEFAIEGHAQYAESGKDIVCAAVSGVSFGTLNAIERLVNIELDVNTHEGDGLLYCQVPSESETKSDPTAHDKVQLLLEGMVISLQSIRDAYAEYVHIRGGEKRCCT